MSFPCSPVSVSRASSLKPKAANICTAAPTACLASALEASEAPERFKSSEYGVVCARRLKASAMYTKAERSLTSA